MDKRFLVVGLVIVSLCANVFAFVGPPTAELKKGQWSAGFDYSQSAQGLETTRLDGTYFNAGSGITDPTTDKVKFKELETQRYYGTIGYGIDDWWELNVSLGIADVKDQYKDAEDSSDVWHGINFDNKLAWGLGTKITFAKQDKVNWGVAVQMNWLDTTMNDVLTNGSHVYYRTMGLSGYDLLVAVGPTVDMGGWKLYGGPFYYYLNGDLDEKYARYDSGVLNAIDKESGDLRTKDNFGGFIGAQVDLTNGIAWTVEVSAKQNHGWEFGSWGLGTGIAFKF
jgi:hypothetical protein